jgi:thiol-disulfide isomerase/thioredoxin
MKHIIKVPFIVGLVLVLLTACGKNPRASEKQEKVSPSPSATGAICETIPAQPSSAQTAVEENKTKPSAQSMASKEEPATKGKSGEEETVKPTEPKPVATATKQKSLPRLWDFGSEKCIPCQTMMGILNPMMQEFKDKVDIRIINVYQEQALARQYRIQVIPTQVFIDPAGKELYRHIGVFTSDSITGKFKEYGFIK